MSRDFTAGYFYRLTPSLLDIGEPFTIACVVNLDDTKHQDFLSKYSSGTWILGTYTGGQFGGYNGAWVVGAATTAARTYHVAWACNAGTGYLYQDGVLAASGGSGGHGVIASNFHIGVRGGPANYVDGRICEAAVWDVTLGIREIAALAKGVSPRITRPSALRGYWPLWGISNPEIDQGKNRLHLTAGGTTPPLARHIGGSPMAL